MAYSSVTPGTLDIPNRVTMLKRFTPTYFQTFTMFPTVPLLSTDGAIVQTFWANCPNYVRVAPPGTDDWNLGFVQALSGTAGADTGGAVRDLTVPMAFWQSCSVTSATVEFIITPMDTALPSTEEPQDYAFADRSAVTLTLSDNWNPFQAGTGVTNIEEYLVIRQGRNTIAATTEFIEGAKSTSAILKHTYTPRKLFPVVDILDREGAFNCSLGPGWADSVVKYPTSGAFWTLYILPAAPQITSYDITGAPEFSRGIPRPHTVQVKIRYNCVFSEPQGPNIPVG